VEFPSFHTHNRKPLLTDGLPRTILPQCNYDVSYSPLKSWSAVFSWSEKGSSVSQNILDRDSLGLPNFYTLQWSVHAQLYSAWSSDTAAAREYPVPLASRIMWIHCSLKINTAYCFEFRKIDSASVSWFISFFRVSPASFHHELQQQGWSCKSVRQTQKNLQIQDSFLATEVDEKIEMAKRKPVIALRTASCGGLCASLPPRPESPTQRARTRLLPLLQYRRWEAISTLRMHAGGSPATFSRPPWPPPPPPPAMVTTRSLWRRPDTPPACCGELESAWERQWWLLTLWLKLVPTEEAPSFNPCTHSHIFLPGCCKDQSKNCSFLLLLLFSWS
jgi:hypothetical protein